MKGNFLFLGTGGSPGVPMIGCECAVCCSSSPYNKRLRSAGVIRVGEKNVLIDVGPDFRAQALGSKITHLNAVLLTHAHADHIAGMDDLRAYYFAEKKKLRCILSEETFDEVKVRYHYMMQPVAIGKPLSAQIDFQILEGDSGEFEVEGLQFQYFSYFQQGMKVTGFRLGDFAYVTDIRDYSKEVFESLKDVRTLVLSAIGHTPRKMHFSIEEAIAFARNVGATKTWLTHISHDLEYAQTESILPADVRMSYDGLEIPIEIG
jgi:phosphoribosyl 1,2-cyclic phosphate phosphodiesterase